PGVRKSFRLERPAGLKPNAGRQRIWIMTHAPDRRSLLLGSGALALSACSPGPADASERQYAKSPFRRLTDAQWRERLPRASYDVLRHEATERPYTSPLNREHRAGTFVCRGCDLPLFRSSWKFESGTGWPSFYDVVAANIGTK